MSLILLTNTQIGLIVFFILLAVGIFLLIFIKNGVLKLEPKKMQLDKVDGKNNLDIKLPYLSDKELKFFDVLRHVLPKEYVCFPKVSINQIVKPKGNIVLFDHIKNDCVDLCVFMRKNMQPIAVIDIIDHNLGNSGISKLDEITVKAFYGISLPVVKYDIKLEYDWGAVLEKFLDALNPITLAELKKNNYK